jgi:hypothetical protein
MRIRAWTIAAGACVVLSGLPAAALAMTVEAFAAVQARRDTLTESKGAAIDETKLERHAPVACVGSQVIELTGVVVRTDSVAIATAAGCEVRIKDSHIVGPIAVQTAGGTVTIENTIIEGGRFAFQMAGDSTVTIKSSTVTGGIQRAAGAFKDLGNNVFR